MTDQYKPNYSGVGGAGCNSLGKEPKNSNQLVREIHLASSRGEISIQEAARALQGLERLVFKKEE